MTTKVPNIFKLEKKREGSRGKTNCSPFIGGLAVGWVGANHVTALRLGSLVNIAKNTAKEDIESYIDTLHEYCIDMSPLLAGQMDTEAERYRESGS